MAKDLENCISLKSSALCKQLTTSGLVSTKTATDKKWYNTRNYLNMFVGPLGKSKFRNLLSFLKNSSCFRKQAELWCLRKILQDLLTQQEFLAQYSCYTDWMQPPFFFLAVFKSQLQVLLQMQLHWISNLDNIPYFSSSGTQRISANGPFYTFVM